MPIDVQMAMVKSIPGLENADMIRPGYAIEYDMVQPTELDPWLERRDSRPVPRRDRSTAQPVTRRRDARASWLESTPAARAGQGPGHHDRTQGYAGILIDDLVSKGVDEPYRMFTSRAEFRLHLRIDNADERLTPLGYQVGTIKQKDYEAFVEKKLRISAAAKFLLETRLDPRSRAGQEIYTRLGLMEAGTDRSFALDRCAIAQAAGTRNRRPDGMGNRLRRSAQCPRQGGRRRLLSREEARRVETDFKYEGYLQQQERQMERMKRAESRQIPDWFEYAESPAFRARW